MPHSPPKLCSRCRRPNCDCRKKARQEFDRWRGTASERGYDTTWSKFRTAFLGGETDGKSNTMCWDCLDEGRITPAAELHHIEKVADRPDRRLDPTNIRPLCKRCHSVRTARGE